MTFFIQDKDEAKLWTTKLAKLISQKGFHREFKPIKTLGKGSSATVYEVLRIEDGARFAAKAFSKSTLKNSSQKLQGFLNELEIMHSLDHKNVLKLEGVFESENSIYVVMETLNGGNLLEFLLPHQTSLNNEEVRLIMRGILKGLR